MLTFVRCTYQVTVVTKAAGEPQLRWTSEEASRTHHGCTCYGYTHRGYTRLGYTYLPWLYLLWLYSLWQLSSYSRSDDTC